jgi:hypothetical protein
MSIVVPLLSTPWTLTSQQIVRGALELCNAISGAEPIGAEDYEVCMRALNGIFKELPLHGISWPRISNNATDITWSSLTPSQFAPPSDYFGVPVLKYTTPSGSPMLLTHISKPQFDELDNTKTGQYPQKFYVAPDLTFNLWPTPTLDPGLKLSYQSVITDASVTQTPDIQAAYLNGMQYWVANEVMLKFDTPIELRRDIAAMFLQKKMMMVQWGVDMAPIFHTVDNT